MSLTTTREGLMSILSFVQAGSTKLPNDIIMKIVREADGGIDTHKKKMKATLDNINLGGYCVVKEGEDGLLMDWGLENKTDLYGRYKTPEYIGTRLSFYLWEDRLKLLFGQEYADHFHLCWFDDQESSEEED